MRMFTALDIMGLMAVASLTVSVVIQSVTILQIPLASSEFQVADEFFVPTANSSVWSLVDSSNSNSNSGDGAETTTMDSIIRLPTRHGHKSVGNTMTTTTITPTRPALATLLDSTTGKVVDGADVSWLLDFAIVGFGKCGTSTVSCYTCCSVCLFLFFSCVFCCVCVCRLACISHGMDYGTLYSSHTRSHTFSLFPFSYP
jgi:hypothetical protein